MNQPRMLLALTAIGVLAAPAALGKAPPPPLASGPYAGVTKQGNVCRSGGKEGQPCSVNLRVSPDKRGVRDIRLSWRAGPCSDNATRYNTSLTDFKGTSVKSDFTFSKSVTEKKPLNGGGQATNVSTVKGKFKRSSTGKLSVSGTLTVVSDLTLPDGTTSHCETGAVSYKAKRSV